MQNAVKSALQQATFYTDQQDYILVKFPANAITIAAGLLAEIGQPFGALIADKDEVTLLTYVEAQETFTTRLRSAEIAEPRFRLITIDVVLEIDLVGFMAEISQALAENNISILTYAAYSRDHLFVQAGQVDAAMQVLEALKKQAAQS